MSDFGDGREERLAAFDLEMRLRRNPEVMRRREDYNQRVEAARQEAVSLGKENVIDLLIENNPAYIRELLETEDERFGAGALYDRYARTFCTNRMKEGGKINAPVDKSELSH